MLRERQNHAWLVHVEGGLVCAGALRVGVVNGLVSDAFHVCICRLVRDDTPDSFSVHIPNAQLKDELKNLFWVLVRVPESLLTQPEIPRSHTVPV